MELNISNTREVWKNIDEYNGIYQVSNFGRVKSVDRVVVFKDGRKRWYKGGVLKTHKTNKGYLFTCLCRNGIKHDKYIHRLVADAFVDNPKRYKCVNHKDGCKTNNIFNNLEWCDNSMNMIHAYRIGLIKPNMFAANNKRIRSVIQFTTDGVLIAEFSSAKAAADKYGYRLSNISRCCRQCYGCKTYKGFIWKYKE